jgi:NAD(P) transhydrogenase subunit alpha
MPEESVSLKIGVPKETFDDERRVALVPEVAAQYVKQGHTVALESGAGEAAGFPDDAYTAKGVTIAKDRDEIFKTYDVILQVRGAGANRDNAKGDLKQYRSGQLIIGHFEPLTEPNFFKKVAETGALTFAIELLPRITKAQAMDALSSMATIAGYKAALLAADAAPKLFPLLMTAAGTVSPAHVLVIGAGVAGLQAIATARRLGAVVSGYDIRTAVKDQVKSLGAKFVELDLEAEEAEEKGGYAKAMGEEFYRRQQELLASVIKNSDVVITTAAVPGKKAPVLVNEDMVKQMKDGSVIVDLAAERGGNCELTKPGETVLKHGVNILGPLNLPSSIPFHASQMYARNLSGFVRHLAENGGLQPNRDDEIIKDTLLTCEGKIVNERLNEILNPQKTEES